MVATEKNADYYNTLTGVHQTKKCGRVSPKKTMNTIENAVNTASIKSREKSESNRGGVLVTREIDFSRLKPVMLPKTEVRKHTNTHASHNRRPVINHDFFNDITQPKKNLSQTVHAVEKFKESLLMTERVEQPP